MCCAFSFMICHTVLHKCWFGTEYIVQPLSSQFKPSWQHSNYIFLFLWRCFFSLKIFHELSLLYSLNTHFDMKYSFNRNLLVKRIWDGYMEILYRIFAWCDDYFVKSPYESINIPEPTNDWRIWNGSSEEINHSDFHKTKIHVCEIKRQMRKKN